MAIASRFRALQNFDAASRYLLVLTLLLNAAAWLLAIYLAPRQRDIIPLHYTIYFGIDLTGRWYGLVWLPAVGTLSAIAHVIFAGFNKQVMWSRMWLTAAVFINILVIICLFVLFYLIRTGGL